MIGERIKSARLAIGYSAEQVAAFLGVSPATVYRYENGDISKLPSKFIKPLADYLCVSPSYLMGWTEDHPDDPLKEKPLSSDARILAQGFDKLPKDQQEKALAVFRVMFEPQFAHLFTKGNDEDDA